jgi:hypothetical protein
MAMASIHQQEVAEMDRRHHLRIRLLSFGGAAALVVIAFWSAGLPPSTWYARLHQWLAHEKTSENKARAPVTANSGAVSIDAPTLAPTTARPLAGTASSISPVPLPLYLISTSPGRNAREGTARIGTSPENPQTYGASAILANGARLTEIRDDYVVLERDHKSAKLYLMKSQGGTSKQALDALLTIGGTEPPKPVVATTREILTDYIRPSPVYDGDVLHGYQVYPGQKSGIFAQMGLHGGDVITAINDAPLVDPTTTLQALNQVTTGVALVVTVERKGTVERLTLDGALIAADLGRSGKEPGQ